MQGEKASNNVNLQGQGSWNLQEAPRLKENKTRVSLLGKTSRARDFTDDTKVDAQQKDIFCGKYHPIDV